MPNMKMVISLEFIICNLLAYYRRTDCKIVTKLRNLRDSGEWRWMKLGGSYLTRRWPLYWLCDGLVIPIFHTDRLHNTKLSTYHPSISRGRMLTWIRGAPSSFISKDALATRHIESGVFRYPLAIRPNADIWQGKESRWSNLLWNGRACRWHGSLRDDTVLTGTRPNS